MTELQLANAKLRATGDYYFRLGQDYLSAGNFESAVQSFKIVIEQYPLDPLVGHARESLAQAEIKLRAENERRAQEQQAAKESRERETAESGEPISYGEFYARSRMGMQIGKRYRFGACLNHIPCLNTSEYGAYKSICSIDPQFDEDSEYERWLTSGKDHCGTIVAGMLHGGTIAVYRLH